MNCPSIYFLLSNGYPLVMPGKTISLKSILHPAIQSHHDVCQAIPDGARGVGANFFLRFQHLGTILDISYLVYSNL